MDRTATLIPFPASERQALELLKTLTLEQLIEAAETGTPENRRRFAAGARRFANYLDAVPLIGHGPRRMAAALLREFAARADLTASRDEAAQRQAAFPRAAAAE